MELADWLRVRVPQAIEVLTAFWENILLPAITAVWAFIRENVLPILFDVAAWLLTNIPVAIDTVAAFVRDTLIPAFEDVWEFIQENVIPIFETVVEWLEENVPIAIEALRKAWEEVLHPALELVWEFIEENVLPLLETLSEFISATLSVALEVMAAIWETRIQPALDAIWEFIKESLLPILEDLWDKIVAKLAPAFEDAKIFLDDLKESLDFVGEAIQSVIGWIQGMIDKLANFSLPSWLESGSPPPLFHALRDIGDAMAQLSQVELPALKVGFQLPGPEDMLAQMSTVPGRAAGGSNVNIGGNSTENHFSLTTQTNLRSGALAAEFDFMEMNSR